MLKAHTARSLRLRIPTLPRSKPSGVTTGAFPFLRPNPATLALDCARAEVPELAPPWRGFSYGHSLHRLQEKTHPGGRGLPIMLDSRLSSFAKQILEGGDAF